MRRDELQELLRGIIVATTTPFDDNFEVDLGRMYELTEWWVESGLVKGKAVIKVASVMGEMPQLADDEWPPLVRTVVQAAGGRVPVMSCVHDKDTKRTIEDALKAQDLGAVGLQIAPPVSNHPNQDDILRYFEAVSDSIDIGIMVYHTPWVPNGSIDLETFRKMADFEHVVAVKWCTPTGYAYGEMEGLADTFNICDNSNRPGPCYKLGGSGFLDHLASAYPPHELKVLELLESRRYDEAQALWDSVCKPSAEFAQKVSQRSGGDARTKKGTMSVMGHPVGAMRPPSLPLSDEELDELRQILADAGLPVPEKAQATVPA